MKGQLLCLCVAIVSQCVYGAKFGPYDAMYNFGDSVSDTGNCLIYGVRLLQNSGEPPYGMTHFGKPTGRSCDGRLIVDFFAEAFGLPYYLVPSLELTNQIGNENFRIGPHFSGANFAVAGATALDLTNSSVGTNASLSVQIAWFKKLKPYLCGSHQDCRRFFKKSLFLVGEIGGNDYNYPLFDGKSIKEVGDMVAPVVDKISNAIITLIEEGATQLLVPGNFPTGCSPIYLTMFQSQNTANYDSLGCLKAYNAFSEFHNSKLKSSLERLRRKYRHAKIMYADYYGATMQYINAPERYGFHRDTVLKACCGGGGKYNYNFFARCGTVNSTICEDRSSYQNWDGVHFTEAAYKVMSDGLLYRKLTYPPLIPYSSLN